MDPTPASSPQPLRTSRVRLTLGVVTIVVGVVAAFGWAAVRRTRLHSQEVTVLCVVRQLSAAADQYFLENGASTVALDHLVGSSNYLRAIGYVAGETYPEYYTRGATITVRGVAGVGTVTYVP
jgi:type IV pilus assembly protein PilA